jgi:polysaccharide biosynthesis transport protein
VRWWASVGTRIVTHRGPTSAQRHDPSPRISADHGCTLIREEPGNGEVPGLADAVHSQVPPLQLSAMAIDGLKLVGAGRMRDHDPADLLASSACGTFFKQLAESFDYVIVDSPSLFEGPEAEAAARWADGVLLVTRRGGSKISDCYESVNRLSDIGAELVGVVLNDVPVARDHERPAPRLAFRPWRYRSAPGRSVNHRRRDTASD